MAETADEQAARELHEKHAGRDHYYNPAKNPGNAWIGGVPMRDLSADEWDALSPLQQQAALDHGYWRLTPVPHETPEAGAPDAAPNDAAAAPRRRAVRSESADDAAPTAGSNAVPSPVAAPTPVGALEPTTARPTPASAAPPNEVTPNG